MKSSLLALAAATVLLASGVLAQPESYESGQRAIREQRWQDAVDLFRESQQDDRAYADASLYWQAYSFCQMGKERQGQRRINSLERKYPESDWLDDAQALAVECSGSEPELPDGSLDPEVQLFVLSQMMDRDPDRALPKVLEMLERTDSDEVRRNALFVLGMGDSEESHQAIAQIARDADNPALQLQAIHVLGAAGDDQTTDLLRDVYAASSDREVRHAVIQAWMMADNEELLIFALRDTDDPELQRQAIQALGMMDASEALRDLYQEFSDRETRMSVLQAFAIAEDSEALEKALETETDMELRRVAIQSIAIAEGDNAAEILVSIYRSSNNREEKMAVLDGLMLLESEPEMVADIARNEQDRELQARAIQSLGVMEAEDYLRDLYASVIDRELRGMVLHSMALAEDAEGLISALEKEADQELRRIAIQALAITDDDDAVDYLVSAYPDSDRQEKVAILQAMMMLDDADALFELLANEQDPELKRAILQTLTMIDSDEAAEYLFKMMERE